MYKCPNSLETFLLLAKHLTIIQVEKNDHHEGSIIQGANANR